MAAARRGTAAGLSLRAALEADQELPPDSVAARLFREGHNFSFFQAVRLLGQLLPGRVPVGQLGPPGAEVVRFRTHQSLSFPPSAVYEVAPPAAADGPPEMTVTFLGLTGSSGVLPRHYTELLLRLLREAKGPE